MHLIMIIYSNFANVKPDYADHSLKPDYADMTCPKHDNADHHYTRINESYTPLHPSVPGILHVSSLSIIGKSIIGPQTLSEIQIQIQIGKHMSRFVKNRNCACFVLSF